MKIVYVSLTLLLAYLFFNTASANVSIAFFHNQEEPSPSPQCVPYAGNFCDADGIRLMNRSCQGDVTEVRRCELKDDLRCLGSGCQTVYETQISINPTPIKLGDKVTITVNGTSTCSSGVSLDQGQGLGTGRTFQDPCTLISHNNCNNLDGGYRCSWTYECRAYRLSGENNHFTATFRSSDSRCTSSIDYTVIEADKCNPASGEDVFDTDAPNTSDRLEVYRMKDDVAITKAFAKALLIPTVNEKLKAQIEPMPGIGVSVGFFRAVLQQLFCYNPIVNNPIFRFISGISGNYCFTYVNLASNQDIESSEAKAYADMAETLSKSERIPEITPIPPPKSCELLDLTADNPKIDTFGDAMLSTVSAALASPGSGIYKNEVMNLPGAILDLTKQNTTLRQKVVTEDYRAPTVECEWHKYMKANYIPGVLPESGCILVQ